MTLGRAFTAGRAGSIVVAALAQAASIGVKYMSYAQISRGPGTKLEAWTRATSSSRPTERPQDYN